MTPKNSFGLHVGQEYFPRVGDHQKGREVSPKRLDTRFGVSICSALEITAFCGRTLARGRDTHKGCGPYSLPGAQRHENRTLK